MNISNGIATMTQVEFDDLKNKGMTVSDGKAELFLYRGYHNKIDIINKSVMKRVTINEFLIIDETDRGLVIYNDHIGDDIFISHDFINFMFTLRDQSNTRQKVVNLVRVFIQCASFNESIFQTIKRENEYRMIKDKLPLIFELSDRTQVDDFIFHMQVAED